MAQQLVTIDVWDTALRRSCDPEAVKLFTCRVLLLRHRGSIADDWTDAWQLLGLRRQIEKDLVSRGRAAGNDGQYELGEVLQRLVGRSKRPEVGAAEVEYIATTLRAAEIAQERFVSRADPTIGELLERHAGARLGFLSDYHLPFEEVANLLRLHGLGTIAARGLVSCDVGASKRTGRLFGAARARFAEGTDRWLHIGDDPIADVAAPARLGIEAQLYAPPSAVEQRQRTEVLLGRPSAVIEAAIRATIEGAVSNRGDVGRRAQLGAVAAPLLAGFSLWLLEIALLRQATTVSFEGPAAGLLADSFRALSNVFSDVFPAAEITALSASSRGSDSMIAELADAADDSARSAASAWRAQLFAPTPSLQRVHGSSYLTEHAGNLPPELLALFTDKAFEIAARVGVEHLARIIRTHVITSDDLVPWALAAVGTLRTMYGALNEASQPALSDLMASLARRSAPRGGLSPRALITARIRLERRLRRLAARLN